MENNEHIQEVEKLEEEVKFQFVDMLSEESNSKNKKIEDFQNEVSSMFYDFKQWLKYNSDPEKIAIKKAKLRSESNKIILKAKVFMHDVKENESIKRTIDSSIETTKKYGEAIVEGVSHGYGVVKENEHVQKVVEVVSEGTQRISENERVREVTSKVKKGTLNIATSAYESLKKVLEDTDKTDHD